MNMENNGGVISTRKPFDSSTRGLWQFYHQSHMVARQGKLVKEIMDFALRSIFFILGRVL
jgi:hypothetical protein